ncbi:hypothetical protein ACIBAG_27975 [Streptomyces sp. NPDC051243]|uniref:hypothetical protein n=1 Tax=Streptomyces sp. NPDC051243 TaxID=3365646 RepID=UPI00379235F7
MRTVLLAATGLPTILLTAALVVVVCFWLLAAMGVADVDSFDADVDLRAWRMGGVPATVAFSLLTVLAWSLSVGSAVLLAVFAPSGPAIGLLRLLVPVVALCVAWVATCRIVRPLHRLFPDERGSSVPIPDEPEPSAPSRTRAGTAPLHTRDRAA